MVAGGDLAVTVAMVRLKPDPHWSEGNHMPAARRHCEEDDGGRRREGRACDRGSLVRLKPDPREVARRGNSRIAPTMRGTGKTDE